MFSVRESTRLEAETSSEGTDVAPMLRNRTVHFGASMQEAAITEWTGFIIRCSRLD